MFQRHTPRLLHRHTLRTLLHACMLAALLTGMLPPPLITSLLSAALPTPAAQSLAQATARLLPQPAVAQAASNVISGHAFRDYNLNGVDDGAGEPGIATIVVTVYNEQGASCQTTTAANGDYTVDIATCNGGAALPSASGELRVEFTRPIDGSLNFLQPGVAVPGSGLSTTVQFVNVVSGNTSNINVGFNDPSEYTQPNPPLVTNQYYGGPQTSITGTLFSFPYTAGCVDSNLNGTCDSGSFDNPTKHKVADINEVGATWGLAYQRSDRTLFAAAFMKRHVGFQQQGKTGVIYKIQDPQGTPTSAAYVDLDNLGFDTGTDPHPPDNASDIVWQQDDNSWDAVGKVGLGGLAVSADEETLWTINLFDRKLYAIPIQTAAVQDSDIVTHTIPNPCSTDVDFRPFATTFHDGKVYVGVTCTGESSATSYTGGQILAPNYVGDRSLLSAYVYSFDPTTATFTQELTVPLNYPRQDAIKSSMHHSPGAWNPWSPTFIAYQNESDPVNCALDRAYPQPWLTDIEFDNGNIILGLRDRFGDQTGYLGHAPSPFLVNNTANCDNLDLTELFTGVGVGDTLRACGNPASGWTIENNATCGGITTTGAGNGDGPGSGEYYYQDDYTNFFHNDVGFGGLAQIPGQPDIASTMLDPQNRITTAYDGGVFWLNNSNGTRSRAYRVYDTVDIPGDVGDHTLAKANGLGDLEALFDAAPIEIGNRIWQDTDGDGIQDPGEPPLSGVQVTLQGITGTIATATTDANGNYYFSSAIGTSTDSSRYGLTLAPNTAYTITVPTSIISGTQTLRLTAPNVNSGTGSDLRDSDANPTTGLISLTTGGPGTVNHTYDFGFAPLGMLVVRKAGPQVTNGVSGQRFAFTDNVLTTNGIVSPTFTLAIGEVITFTNVISGVYNITETVPADWQLTGASCSNGDAPTAVHIGDTATITCVFTNDVTPKPAIALRKYTNGYDADIITGPYLAVGSPVTWTYIITNTGNVTLTNLTLSDDRVNLSGATCAPVALGGHLAPDTTTTCTMPGTATAGQYTNTAVVTGTNSLAPTQQVTSTNPSHYFGVDPDFVLKKYTNGYDADTLSEARPHLRLGDPVTWTYVITNTGNLPMFFAANSLRDDQEGIIAHAAFTLTPGASTTLIKSDVVKTIGIYTNLGTIPGVPVNPPNTPPDLPTFPLVNPPSTPITKTNPSHYDAVSAPAIALRKYTNGYDADVITGPYLAVGSPVTWTYIITNTGNVTLTHVTLTDDQVGGITCPVTILAPRATTTCTKTGIVTAGQYTNTAVVTGTNSLTPTQQVTSTNPSHYFGADPDFVLKKYTNGYDADTLSDARPHLRLGDPVTWTYVITNTGNLPMFFAANSLRDDQEGIIAHAAFTLTPGQTMTMTQHGSASTLGTYTNTATVPGIPVVPPSTPPDLPTFPPATPPNTPITKTNPSHYDTAVYGAIGNYIWVDENSDGHQDTGEPGIPNVRMVLYDTNGNQVAETRTDSSGHYLFPDLPLGDYFVDLDESTLPASMTQTPLYLPGEDFGNQDQSRNPASGDYGYPATITVTAPENLTADFGYNYRDTTTNTGLATLGDRVWIDSNGDGQQDPSEIGVSGVVLTLYTAGPDGLFNTPDDRSIMTDTTDVNGYYLFDDLQPGAYTVRVTDSSQASHDVLSMPTYDQTGDPDHFGQPASTANPGTAYDNYSTQPIVLDPGDVFLNVDFGYQPKPTTPLGSIGDTVWFDADADGNGPAQPPIDSGASVTQGAGGTADTIEYGIPGVTVALIQDLNGDGKWQPASEPIIARTVTNQQGQYLFSDLPLDDGSGAAHYLVWVNDTDNVLQDLTQSYDKDGVSSPDLSARTLSIADPDPRDQDFGYAPSGQTPQLGAIGDTIWLDVDGSGGAQNTQGNEPGIEGVLVTLTYPNGNVLTTTTDENGHYYFGGLPLNQSYTVTVAPVNFQPGGVLEGLGETFDKDGNQNHQTTTTLTPANPIDLTNDFSYTPAPGQVGRIGNLVWLDTNANGVYEPAAGETPIAGVTVDLYRDLNGNGQVDPGEPRMATTVTSGSIDATAYGGDGNYLFTGLPAGDYVVDVSDRDGVLAGYWHSLGATGQNNHSQSDPYAVTIGNGQPLDNLTADFGYYVDLAALGNYVWYDADHDGLQDASEQPLANVTVRLTIVYTGGVTTVLTTKTDANGHYAFDNLLADENYNRGSNTNGADGNPVFTISVVTPTGYTPTLVDVNGNALDKQDSDRHSGVTALPVQGQTDVTAKDPVTDEPTIASYDFGFWQPVLPASIGNYVWYDENSDGHQDAGEPGIPNVILNLTDKNGTVYTTTTDAHGGYLFSGLVSGTYTVTVAPVNFLPGGPLETVHQTPHGTTPNVDFGNQTAPYVVHVDAGESNLTADFGYVNSNPPSNDGLASLGDRVWVDNDQDGHQDPDEVGIPNVVVQLYVPGADGRFGTPDDQLVDSTTTDANGNYLFTDLPAGAYVVKVDPTTLPAGYTQSGDPDHFGTTGSDNDNQTTTPVVLSPGDVFLNADFGYHPNAGTPVGQIGDTVWLDVNASGTPTQDAGEPGIPGVTVTLIKDTNGDGIWQPLGSDGLPGTADDEPILATDTTDQNGKYLFDNLPLSDGSADGDADYIVWVNDTQGVLQALRPTYDEDSPLDNQSHTALSTGTRADLNQDFSYTPRSQEPSLGLVGDTIWLNPDGDNVQDPNEPGIEGVVVTLTYPDGTVITTTTDSNGHYYFGGLPLNQSYTVTVAPVNFQPGGVLEGLTNTADKEGDHNNLTTTALLTSANPTDLTNDLGYTPAPGQVGRIGNLVWLDTNANGVYEPANGETPIAGVTVDLYRDLNGNGAVDPDEPRMATTVTSGSIDATAYGSDGNYLFTGLPAGDYVVDVSDRDGVLAGYWHSLGATGQNNHSQSDPYAVTIGNGQPLDNLTADFGYYVKLAALGNYVWFDDDHDGLQDASEQPLANVTVRLTIVYTGGVTTVLTTTTDANGHYSFGNLLADENYNQGSNTNGADGNPVFTISVVTPTGYTPTLVDVNGNALDKQDADNPTGVLAQPLKGQTDVTAQTPVTNEPTIASYDFGYYVLPPTPTNTPTPTDTPTPTPTNTPTPTDTPTPTATNTPTPTDTPTPTATPTNTPTATPTQVLLSLGNYVWFDANNNGLVDVGESGIRDITLQLFHAGDDPTMATPLASTTTDATGHYIFNNLTPGSYFVYLPTPPLSYPWSSTPTDSADNGEDNDDNGIQPTLFDAVSSPVIELMPGSEPTNDGDGANGDLTVDFGFFAPASIGDLVWFDTDRDGVQDRNETGRPGTTDLRGVPNVLVKLYDAVTNQIIMTTTTDTHGDYLFDNLLPGDYFIEFTVPAGYELTSADVVTATDMFDSDVTLPTLRTPVTTLTSGEYDPTWDMGLYLPNATQPAAIGDRVWFDANNNGVQDSQETGVPGVAVTLVRADGTAVATTTTDATGYYQFNSLPPGDYYLIFTPPASYVISPQDQGANDIFDSDVDPATGHTVTTTLTAGENDLSWDLGLYVPTPPAAIGDFVWFDTNVNGVQDSGETGVPGVTVALYRADGTLVTTVLTDPDGHYAFTNLLPGEYYLVFTPPSAYLSTSPNQGTNDAVDSDPNPAGGRTPVTVLEAGEQDMTWDYGLYLIDDRTTGVIPPAALGNRVWEDLNHNGVQDQGEPNIPGVTVKLCNEQGELVAIDVTDANGIYGFSNLPPGNYYVEVVFPDGYTVTAPHSNLGTTETDSDADPETGRTQVVTLSPGENDLSLDTGLYRISTSLVTKEEPEISNRVFLPLVTK